MTASLVRQVWAGHFLLLAAAPRQFGGTEVPEHDFCSAREKLPAFMTASIAGGHFENFAKGRKRVGRLQKGQKNVNSA